VASGAKNIQSLQLRVQLRILTGFPLDTRKKSITNSAANIRQNRIKECIGGKKYYPKILTGQVSKITK